METLENKITLNLDSNAEVSVKGFIAPFEYDSSGFHSGVGTNWRTYGSLNRKSNIPHRSFNLFSHRNWFQWETAGRFKKKKTR